MLKEIGITALQLNYGNNVHLQTYADHFLFITADKGITELKKTNEALSRLEVRRKQSLELDGQQVGGNACGRTSIRFSLGSDAGERISLRTDSALQVLAGLLQLECKVKMENEDSRD